MENVIAALNQERERLVAELRRVDELLKMAGGTEGVALKAGRRPKPMDHGSIGTAKGTRGPQSKVKDKIVAALQAAGAKGASLQELEARLILKRGTLGQWFATTGKRIKQIKNIGRGQYVWKEKAPAERKAATPA